MDDVENAVKKVTEGVRDFATEMRQLNIHVGMGVPPWCVNCGGEWPCEPSKAPPEGVVRND